MKILKVMGNEQTCSVHQMIVDQQRERRQFYRTMSKRGKLPQPSLKYTHTTRQLSTQYTQCPFTRYHQQQPTVAVSNSAST